MPTAHSSTRKRQPACRAAALALLAAALGILGAWPASAGAELVEETHEFYLEHANPAWGSMYTISFDLPQFDTRGGERELLGCTLAYFYPDLDYTWSVSANPTTDTVGCQVNWDVSFAAYGPSGLPWIPLPPDPAYITFGRGIAVWRAPFMQGEGPYTELREWDYPNRTQITADPTFLAQVTGAGSIPMVAELILSDLTVEPIEMPTGYPQPEYDPNLLSVTPDEVSAGLWVTYHFNADSGACCHEGGCTTLDNESECYGTYGGEWYPGQTCVGDGGDFECPSVSACCDEYGYCSMTTGNDCYDWYGGTWYEGETCIGDGGDFACPPNPGACCAGGTCHTLDYITECWDLEGEWFEGETCVADGGSFECPAVAACCDEWGECATVTEADCYDGYGGTWYEGETCTHDGGDFNCPPDPGACCTSDGTCHTLDYISECWDLAGEWYAGATCVADGGSFECPPVGACCDQYGSCSMLPEANCYNWYGGTWFADETCASAGGDFQCPADPGACCTDDGTCQTLDYITDCWNMNGEWYAGETCAADGGDFECPSEEVCGDLDGDEDVDYDDYVIFLDAFGGVVDGNPPEDGLCDYDGSGAIGMADYAAWLECYRDFVGDPLAGPPPPPPSPGPSRLEVDLGAERALQPRSGPAVSVEPRASQPWGGSPSRR